MDDTSTPIGEADMAEVYEFKAQWLKSQHKYAISEVFPSSLWGLTNINYQVLIQITSVIDVHASK